MAVMSIRLAGGDDASRRSTSSRARRSPASSVSRRRLRYSACTSCSGATRGHTRLVGRWYSGDWRTAVTTSAVDASTGRLDCSTARPAIASASRVRNRVRAAWKLRPDSRADATSDSISGAVIVTWERPTVTTKLPSGGTRTRPQQASQDGCHPATSLEGGDRGALVRRLISHRYERVDVALLDGAFTKRGQDLTDVADERPVGADNEHAGAAEGRIGVDEPRGAVQADCGLAGAGAALDDECRQRLLGDRLVLLRGDRGDDLPHLADSPPGDVLVDRLGEVVLATAGEVLVDEPEQPVILDIQTSSQRDSTRVPGRRRIERLGGRRSPVDREQAVAAVDDHVPSDVGGATPPAVDPPEVQRAARFGVDPDALAPQLVERLVRELVDAAAGAPRPQLRQRPVERLDRTVQMLLADGARRGTRTPTPSLQVKEPT